MTLTPQQTARVAVGIALPLLVIAVLAVAGHSSVTDTTTERVRRGPERLTKAAKRLAALTTA